MIARSTSTIIAAGVCLLASCHADTKVYMAEITGLGSSDVTGSVVVFTPKGDNQSADYEIGYGGFLKGTPAECTGCGVHIHAGKSCDDSTKQEGHYFVEPVIADPWNSDTVYTSDKDGVASFSGLVKIGTDKIEGHAFVVHSADGGRIGCGLLNDVSANDVLSADLKEVVAGSGHKGSVTGYQIASSSQICVHGGGTIPISDKFGGAHVHEGVSCTDIASQKGHYFEGDYDPWNAVGYEKTDPTGYGSFMACVDPGVTEYAGKTFILHTNDGGRAACGVMTSIVNGSSSDEDSASFTLRVPSFVLQTTIFIAMCYVALFT